MSKDLDRILASACVEPPQDLAERIDRLIISRRRRVRVVGAISLMGVMGLLLLPVVHHRGTTSSSSASPSKPPDAPNMARSDSGAAPLTNPRVFVATDDAHMAQIIATPSPDTTIVRIHGPLVAVPRVPDKSSQEILR